MAKKALQQALQARRSAVPTTPDSTDNVPPTSSHQPSSTDQPSQTTATPHASKVKFDFITDNDRVPVNDEILPTTITHLSQLQGLFNNLRCGFCGKKEIVLEKTGRKGLNVTLQSRCRECLAVGGTANTSRKVVGSSEYEVNNCIAAAALNAGIGHAKLTKFSEVVGLHRQSSCTFSRKLDKCHKATELLKREVCERARDIVVSLYSKDRDGYFQIEVTFDGTWQKRGHTSNNGAAAVLCAVTGLVLDYHIMSKHCQVNK